MASGSQPRQDTPIAADPMGGAEGEVTVVDPHHPLFACTFPLVEVMGEGGDDRYCVVRLPGGGEGRLPVEVTDRAAVPVGAYPLPLSLAAVERLLAAYARVECGAGDEAARPGDSETSAVSPSPKPVRDVRLDRAQARRTLQEENRGGVSAAAAEVKGRDGGRQEPRQPETSESTGGRSSTQPSTPAPQKGVVTGGVEAGVWW